MKPAKQLSTPKIPQSISKTKLLVTLIIAISIITQVSFMKYQKARLESAHALELNQAIDQIETQSQEQRLILQQQLQTLELENVQLLDAYTIVSTESAQLEYETLTSNLDLYQGIRDKTADYQSKGVNVTDVNKQLDTTLQLFLDNKSQELSTLVNQLDDQLESALTAKLEEDKKKAAAAAQASAPLTSNPPGGYSRITVATSRGNFVTDMIKVSLGSVEVRTSTAQDGNCDNDCQAKPLAQHIADNSGFAGINGSYFCPPDYSACAGKVNSYDFPVYSTQHGKWINADKLFWNDRGMAAFNGTSPRFCVNANSCDNGSITAGIVNYPSLVSGGQVIVNEGALPSSLTQTKGYRGGIGTDGSSLYLMITRGATVTDAAHVMTTVGITEGLNLDGGGSSALYYNGYKVGPGRALPNAVVIKQR